jgi:hypothetical protein
MSDTAGCTNNDKRHVPLRIERLSDGGFMVSEAFSDFGRENGRYCAPLFASTSIGEALAFMCQRLDPEAFKAWQQAKEDHAKAAEAWTKCSGGLGAGNPTVGNACSHCGLHKSRCECPSRDFAKARDASPDRRCAVCGSSPKSRCFTCGRGVGVFDPN